MRADARRNRDRLVAVASAVVAERGAGASLEEIARRAGVGSATLHRHFESRQALLDAVFSDRVDALCDRAEALLSEREPGPALASWLSEVVRHATTNRGLGATLLKGTGDSCHAKIVAAGERLVDKAQAAGAVKADVTTQELLKLANGVALAAEDDAVLADRLLSLAVSGIVDG